MDAYEQLVADLGYLPSKFAKFAESLDYILGHYGPIETLRAYHVLDSGFGWGISSVMLLRRYPEASVTCIDPYWPGTYSDARPVMDYQPTSIRKRWTFIRGRLEDIGLPGVEIFPPAVDLVMLDADHNYPSTLYQLEAVYPRIRKGGLLICHDAKEGVPVLRAIEEFELAHHIHFERWPGVDACGWAWLRKGE